MPLTKLTNTTLDGIVGREPQVKAAIVNFITADALCYRASNPAELVAVEQATWDPLLTWAQSDLGLEMAVTKAVTPLQQPDATIKQAAAIVDDFDAFALAALHVLTTLTGSLILALALARAHLSPDQAWQAAHVDEDFQISRWGEDVEATKRRALHRKEFNAAHRLLTLLG